MIHMSSTRLIQNLFFVFCAFLLVLGDHKDCRYELCGNHDCKQFHWPINTCGNFSSFENLTCVCENLTTTSDIKQTYGFPVIHFTEDDQKYEVRPCKQTHPFICSDSNNNFQIYAEENRTWTDAVKSCKERHLHIAQVSLNTINFTSNTVFWIGSFNSSASTSDIDVSQFQMTDTYVRCKLQPDMSRTTTNSVRLTSLGVTQTTDERTSTTPTVTTPNPLTSYYRPSSTTTGRPNVSRIIPASSVTTPSPNKELTPETENINNTLTQMPGGSHEASDVPHSYTAVIVGAVSGGVVLIIIGVTVVFVRKTRNHRKPQNSSLQMSDIVGLARYTDQSLRGKSRADDQPQNPIYLPKDSSSYNGIGNRWNDIAVELDDENNYDHFEKTKIPNDIETENDTYDHTRLDIQVADSIDGYGVLHQKTADMIDGVYDHVGSLAEGTYGHLHQKDGTSRPDSDTYN